MFEVAVAQYGHERLKGDRHWALLVVHDPCADSAHAFQLTGSTSTYEVKPPEIVSIARAQSYLGKVVVGAVSPDQLAVLEHIARAVPIVRGDRSWHCQHWIVDVLAALHAHGLSVRRCTRQQLADHFATAVAHKRGA
ncbi:hypothetical protein AURDEDRAFT_114527 [Auricularia subglabra TFB-10046 SS5]|nr:hypothetical protein AURDEDRAFT_114527 [Auricularia subglabra TFB-10046 SS5]